LVKIVGSCIKIFYIGVAGDTEGNKGSEDDFL